MESMSRLSIRVRKVRLLSWYEFRKMAGSVIKMREFVLLLTQNRPIKILHGEVIGLILSRFMDILIECCIDLEILFILPVLSKI